MRHIPSLDGLRGIAILMVIAFHYYYFVPVFSAGWTGVDLFFVLSGYLITGRLLASLDKPGYFANFYRNRILRIFPLYFAILITFYIGIHFFTKPSTQPLLAYYHTHWPSYYLFFVNWTFIHDGMPLAPYLTHFWSLSIEEQFYLFWPFLIFCIKNSKHRIVVFISLFLLVIVARCITFHYYGQPDNPVFYFNNTFFRADSLILGALLAQLHLKKTALPRRLFPILFIGSGVTLLTYIIFVYPPDPWRPFFETIGYSIIAIFSACLIHLSITRPEKFPAKIFSNRLLGFIGKISYGLYVIHFLIMQIFFSRFYRWYDGHFPASETPSVQTLKLVPALLSATTCLVITFVLSYLSYKYFETPFLKLKKRSPLSGKTGEMTP